jgi:uncharacterized protein YqeY
MTIKENINADFLTAMKAKDVDAKAALSSIKAAITVAEKANGNVELTDAEVLKLITKAIKQREESIAMFDKGGREDLSLKEAAEAAFLRNYLPAQMSYDKISNELIIILQEIAQTVKNPQALVGKTIGEFNKRHQGKADVGTVKEILAKLVEV